MSDQLSLDDITSRYHRGNPESIRSHQSIVNSKARLQRQVLDYVREKGSDGATSDEVEQALELAHQTVSARLTELKASGHLLKTPKRRKTRSGRDAAVLIWSGK